MTSRFTVHIKIAMLSYLRTPAYWVPAVIFPAMLYSMFGVNAPAGRDASYVMASFCAYAVIGVGFYQFGVSIAAARETAWEKFMRVLPRAFWPKLVALMVSAGFFAIVAVLLVIVAAYLFSAPDADAATVLKLIAATFIIALPFVLFGVALGYLVSARTAVPLANMIFLPLAFLGGLWMRPSSMHPVVGEISLYTPTRHAAEIVWAVVGHRDIPGQSVMWLLGYSALFAALAWWGYRRDEAKRYG
jgi:ABC-2 type transport system permease protein